jgi:folate-dependent phosphoribosylglycinamide formyltransferase PurN
VNIGVLASHEGTTLQSLAERVQTCERALIVEVLGSIAKGDLTLPIRPNLGWRIA